jgi:hypothetical protein
MEKSKLLFRILILVICCFHLPAHSQEPYQKLLWGPHFYTCEGVTPAWDSGFIFTDRTLAKISSGGDLEWAKNYKVNTWLRSIVKTSDSGYIATGTILFFNTGTYKILTIKVDNTGNLIWHKIFGSPDESDHVSQSICQTNDGNYILAGGTSYYGVGQSDAYLIKIDGNGNVIWARTIGQELSDWPNRIKQDDDGNSLLIGYTRKTSENMDLFLTKFNADGDTLWSKSYGASGPDSGHDVIKTSDGGYAILGTKYISSYRLVDMALLKTDSIGNFLWAKTYGGSDVDEGRQLWELPDHGFILAGQTESFGAGGDCDPIGPCRDYYLIRTDQYGDTLWTQAYGIQGTQEWLQGLMLTEDKGYLLFGESATDYGSNSYLVKTDSNGYCPCNTFSTNTIVANAVFNVDSWGWMSHGFIMSETTTAVEDVDIVIDSMLCEPVGIKEDGFQSFSLYPNPATTILHIDLPEENNKVKKELSIYDQIGRIKRRETIPAGVDHYSIDVSAFGNGIYVIIISNENSLPLVGKFVINR